MVYLYCGNFIYDQQPSSRSSFYMPRRAQGEKGNLHKGSNNPTTITKPDLDRDSHTTFDGSANVVSIPHDHDWDHGVHVACAKESADVLGGGDFGCHEQDIADYCSRCKPIKKLGESQLVAITGSCKTSSERTMLSS